jgi:hypothetical protein
MRIDGLFEIKQAHRRMARPHQIKVNIGSPMMFPPHAPPDQIAAQLQKKVENL